MACDPSCPTMGVSLFGGKDSIKTWDRTKPVWLVWNPEFVLRIPLSELVGVLLHEINHVLFGHLLMDEKRYLNRGALIVAQEVTVNEFVKEPLPSGCVLLKNWPMLKEMESTHFRYNKLKNQIRQVTIVWDVDGLWGKNIPAKDKAKLKRAIQGMIDDAAMESGQGVPKDMTDVCREHGMGTNSIHEMITRGDSKLNWRSVLAKFVGDSVEPMPTYSRPSRRFPDLVGILPGKQRLGNKPRVMAAIDTSGSITQELLSTISGELTSLARNYEVLVVECDVSIHRVYPYKREITDVVGRGGTDLRPPLDSKFLAKHKPDVVVYFTDGMGQAPKQAIKTPLVWCLTMNGSQPCQWGMVVRMN